MDPTVVFTVFLHFLMCVDAGPWRRLHFGQPSRSLHPVYREKRKDRPVYHSVHYWFIREPKAAYEVGPGGTVEIMCEAKNVVTVKFRCNGEVIRGENKFAIDGQNNPVFVSHLEVAYSSVEKFYSRHGFQSAYSCVCQADLENGPPISSSAGKIILEPKKFKCPDLKACFLTCPLVQLAYGCFRCQCRRKDKVTTTTVASPTKPSHTCPGLGICFLVCPKVVMADGCERCQCRQRQSRAAVEEAIEKWSPERLRDECLASGSAQVKVDGDCSKFILCHGVAASLVDCPPGQVFQEGHGGCVPRVWLSTRARVALGNQC